MARLPNPGSDDGEWGSILNEFLEQIHASDGALKPATVGSDQLQSGAVGASVLSDDISQTISLAGAPSAALSDAPTVNVNAALSRSHKVTLTASGRTIGAPQNGYDGQIIVITIAQDGVGGRVWTLHSAYRLPDGVTVTPSTDPGVKDKLAVQYDADDGVWDVLGWQPGYGAA